jgi:hypothetical protein
MTIRELFEPVVDLHFLWLPVIFLVWAFYSRLGEHVYEDLRRRYRR